MASIPTSSCAAASGPRRILALLLALVLALGMAPLAPVAKAYAATKAADGMYHVQVLYQGSDGAYLKNADGGQLRLSAAHSDANAKISQNFDAYVKDAVSQLEANGYALKSMDGWPGTAGTFGTAKDTYTIKLDNPVEAYARVVLVQNGTTLVTLTGQGRASVHTAGELLDTTLQSTLKNRGLSVASWGGYDTGKTAKLARTDTKDKPRTFTITVTGGTPSEPAVLHSVNIRITDQQGNPLALFTQDGKYYDSVGVSGTQGMSYSKLVYTNAEYPTIYNKTLDAILQQAIATHQADGYTLESNGEWPGNAGTVGAEDVVYTVVMHKEGSGSMQTMVFRFVDESGKTLSTSSEGSANGLAGTKLGAEAMQAVNAAVAEIQKAGYQLVSMGGLSADTAFDFDSAVDQEYTITFKKVQDSTAGGNQGQDSTKAGNNNSATTPAATETSVRVDFVDTATNQAVAYSGTWSGSTASSITATVKGVSLKSEVEQIIAEQKKAGYTITDRSAWDAVVKAGTYPAGGTKASPKVITIKMTKSGSSTGGNTGGNTGGTTTPTTKQTTITVHVVTSDGASGTSTATHTVGSSISSSGLDQLVQSRVNSYRAKGYTQIDWGGWDKAKNGTFPANNTTYTIKMTKPGTAKNNLTRLGGKNALGTMQLVVNTGFASADTVVIATNGGYWDALAASSLAGAYRAPVLLTNKNTLSPETRQTIQKLGAKRAFICGGTAAVSQNVYNQVKALCPTIKRVAGTNAIGTAIAVANEVGSARSTTCIIATSRGYWDALSASPFAYATRSPIYLTKTDGTLDDATIAAIAKAGYTRAVIAGGTAAVKESTQRTLRNLGITNIVRNAGKTAYETSGDFAQWSVTQGMSPNNLGVATGSGYWDALTGGAVCGANNAVLVLADDGKWQNVNGFITRYRSQINNAYVFGGSMAVGTSTYNAINRIISK